MKIPVFVSCSTHLSTEQNRSRELIIRILGRLKLEPRALGRSDYPTELPLREVLGIAKHCAGGVILGFEQFRSLEGVDRPGTDLEKKVLEPRSFPTPWNHLEAGILFGLKVPLLVFREEGVSGGIFDDGVMEAFTHRMPTSARAAGLNDVFLKWHGSVRQTYDAASEMSLANRGRWSG
jgi:hypothetical protein